MGSLNQKWRLSGKCRFGGILHTSGIQIQKMPARAGNDELSCLSRVFILALRCRRWWDRSLESLWKVMIQRKKSRNRNV